MNGIQPFEQKSEKGAWIGGQPRYNFPQGQEWGLDMIGVTQTLTTYAPTKVDLNLFTATEEDRANRDV